MYTIRYGSQPIPLQNSIKGLGFPEQRVERAKVLEEIWRAENNELVTETGLLSLKKT